jgi:glycine oxidase
VSPSVRGGLFSEQEASVDSRRLVDALAARVQVREGAEVAGVARDHVTLANGETITAGRVVVCAGAWSGFAGVPVRPVKGQVIRLRGELPAQRMVRTEHVYVVPRQNGEVVLGATVEERGFDTTVTAGAVHELLREGYRVLPELAELELVDVSAGLRPGTPDNDPIVGTREDGVLVATGHYRNGILLTPVTAETIAALLAGDAAPPEALPFAPERLVTA